MFTRAFLVYGLPSTGKSTFCSLYQACVKNSIHFNLDTVFLSPFYLDSSVLDIAQHINAGMLNKNLFMNIFEKSFSKWFSAIPENSIRDILIEGYELYYIDQEIKFLLESYKISEIIKIEMNNYSFVYKSKVIQFSIGSGTETFQRIVEDIHKEDYKEIKHHINYQTFEDLDAIPYSRSKEKLKMSGVLSLPGCLLWRSFLDIGCNNGYMCFRVADKFGNVLGIDSVSGALSVAQYLNNHIYQNENVSFKNTDFYDSSFHPTADVIYCSSFLHYSLGEPRVIEFFTKCHSILNDGGILILEIELYPHMETSHLEVIGRPAGGDGSYPNLPWIIEHTKNRFIITYLAQSLFQPGGNYNRYFFHFKKI